MWISLNRCLVRFVFWEIHLGKCCPRVFWVFVLIVKVSHWCPSNAVVTNLLDLMDPWSTDHQLVTTVQRFPYTCGCQPFGPHRLPVGNRCSNEWWYMGRDRSGLPGTVNWEMGGCGCAGWLGRHMVDPWPVEPLSLESQSACELVISET